jgi:hypothetical protein
MHAACRRHGNAASLGPTSLAAPDSDSITAVAAPTSFGHTDVAATIASAPANERLT